MGSDQTHPSCTARMPILSQASLRAQAWSRRAKKTQRSGTGPEQALEAIKPSLAHSAKADPPPELTCERRPGPAEPLQRQ